MGRSEVDIAAAVRALRPKSGISMVELASDLAARWSLAEPAQVGGWMTRPAILRRVAAALGGRIAPDVDRIVATGPGAEALGAAVALSTGLPYVVIQPVEPAPWGERYDGERLCIVGVLASANADLAALPGTEGAGSLALLGDGPGADALFRVDDDQLIPLVGGSDDADRDQLSRLVAGMLTSEGAADVWLETAASPARIAQLGEHMARVLSPLAPDAIACWHDPDEAALAQAVAQVLALPVTRADLDLGLVSLSPALPAHADRVLLLASSWNSYRPLGALAGVIANSGRDVIAAVSLFDSPGTARTSQSFAEIVLGAER